MWNSDEILIRISDAIESHNRLVSKYVLSYPILPRLLLILTIVSAIMSARLSHSAELTFAWEYHDDAIGYYIYYGFESGNYSAKIDVGSELQYTISGLDDLKSYYFAATAYNEFGESDFSEEIVYAPNACNTDIDFDGDIDGSDLALFTENPMGTNVEAFSLEFGSMHCPP